MPITTTMTLHVNIALFDKAIEQQYLSDAIQDPDNSDHSSEYIQHHLQARLENQRILVKAILESTHLKPRFLQALLTRYTQTVSEDITIFLRDVVCELGMQDRLFPCAESGLLFEDEIELILDSNMIRLTLSQ